MMQNVRQLREEAMKITNMISNVALCDESAKDLIEGFLFSAFHKIQSQTEKSMLRENIGEKQKSNRGSYKRVETERTCECCKQTYVGNSNSRYCSRNCQNASFHARQKVREEIKSGKITESFEEYRTKHGAIYSKFFLEREIRLARKRKVRNLKPKVVKNPSLGEALRKLELQPSMFDEQVTA